MYLRAHSLSKGGICHPCLSVAAVHRCGPTVARQLFRFFRETQILAADFSITRFLKHCANKTVSL